MFWEVPGSTICKVMFFSSNSSPAKKNGAAAKEIIADKEENLDTSRTKIHVAADNRPVGQESTIR